MPRAAARTTILAMQGLESALEGFANSAGFNFLAAIPGTHLISIHARLGSLEIRQQMVLADLHTRAAREHAGGTA
jgi:hypothetical protein